ncbi:hypothetical protein FNW02_01040 [Komarekiella sp. 'clone 1']|uniref:Uncharacterized protein n=1 Tax=Komarekiella delphini-convector SJRDD-AB1 TaxID=2593771 RepID=A0AA40VP92_9NOST|nr:hypothetical protein [Komarekiella delphini-convector]MBD6614492.1 hypothetical protein [Komarekiella delphini-convector SJRDD-AB1]
MTNKSGLLDNLVKSGAIVATQSGDKKPTRPGFPLIGTPPRRLLSDEEQPSSPPQSTPNEPEEASEQPKKLP